MWTLDEILSAFCATKRSYDALADGLDVVGHPSLASQVRAAALTELTARINELRTGYLRSIDTSLTTTERVAATQAVLELGPTLIGFLS
jgi:hypothetical protein